jgi:hypothetical protein
VNLPSRQVSALTAVALTALVFLGTTGCSRDGSSEGETAGTTTTQGSSTEDSTTEISTTIDDTSDSGMMSTETDTDDGTDDPTLSGGSFYAGPTDFSSPSECDPWMQDCPEGEKCVPYASTGGNWDANKCVVIIGDGEPGDACNSGGVVEATDNCDGSSVCWNVELIDDELVGTCTAFCTGTPDQPQCAEGSTCVVANDGSITLCMQACDPLAQDCEEGFGCHWVGNQFACLAGLDEPIGEPCDVGECSAGSACVAAELVPDCAGTACCAAFCSISEPTCVEPTSECIPFFEDPPAGYEDVGICVAP